MKSTTTLDASTMTFLFFISKYFLPPECYESVTLLWLFSVLLVFWSVFDCFGDFQTWEVTDTAGFLQAV